MNDSETTLENIPDWYNRWTLELFKEHLKGSVLEVGCGIGNFTKLLSDFSDLTALDVEDDYIDKVKDMVKSAKVGKGDIEKGTYFFDKNSKFDSIICLNVLEHINDDKKALENIYRLLRNEGKLILLVPIHKMLYGEIDRSISHFRRYEVDEVKMMLNKLNFKILKIRKLNSLGAIGWFIAGKILGQRSVGKGNMRIFNAIVHPFMFLEKFIEPPFGTSVLVVAQK